MVFGDFSISSWFLFSLCLVYFCLFGSGIVSFLAMCISPSSISSSSLASVRLCSCISCFGFIGFMYLLGLRYALYSAFQRFFWLVYWGCNGHMQGFQFALVFLVCYVLVVVQGSCILLSSTGTVFPPWRVLCIGHGPYLYVVLYPLVFCFHECNLLSQRRSNFAVSVAILFVGLFRESLRYIGFVCFV